jgi:hypothetical protein
MRALLRSVIGVALLAAVAGCGGTANPGGKVTFQGKPVVFGTVVMIGPDGIPKSGAIEPDGSYRVRGVRVGTAKVTVSSPPPPGRSARKAKVGRDADDDERRPADEGTPASPEVIKAWFPLPEKYADPAKSDLKAEVKPGQPVNLELK